jgi:hypothetical protein
VNYFRDLNVSQVRFGLVADRINQLGDRWTASPIDRELEQPIGADVYS